MIPREIRTAPPGPGTRSRAGAQPAQPPGRPCSPSACPSSLVTPERSKAVRAPAAAPPAMSAARLSPTTRLSPAGTPTSDIAISNIARARLAHTDRLGVDAGADSGDQRPCARDDALFSQEDGVQAGSDEGSPRPHQAHGVGKCRIREGAIETDDDDVSMVALRRRYPGQPALQPLSMPGCRARRPDHREGPWT